MDTEKHIVFTKHITCTQRVLTPSLLAPYLHFKERVTSIPHKKGGKPYFFDLRSPEGPIYTMLRQVATLVPHHALCTGYICGRRFLLGIRPSGLGAYATPCGASSEARTVTEVHVVPNRAACPRPEFPGEPVRGSRHFCINGAPQEFARGQEVNHVQRIRRST